MGPALNRVVVGIGSNIKPQKNIALAREMLGQRFPVLREATPRKTRPVGPGGPPQPDFVNSAVLIETALTPAGLKKALRDIEAGLGRKRTADKFAARPIDLDILVWNAAVVDPDVFTRPFLKELIQEILPEVTLRKRLKFPAPPEPTP